VLYGAGGVCCDACGLVVTEVGRQPFTVYRLLRAADSTSTVELSAIAGSATAFVSVYIVVFGVGFIYMLRVLVQAPTSGEHGPNPELAEMSGARSDPATKSLEERS